MTSLTRAKFFNLAEQHDAGRSEVVDVPIFGQVRLREPSQEKITGRALTLNKSPQNAETLTRFNVMKIIDWVVDDDDCQVFTEEDLPELLERPASEIGHLIAAIRDFEEKRAGEQTGGFDDIKSDSAMTNESDSHSSYA